MTDEPRNAQLQKIWTGHQRVWPGHSGKTPISGTCMTVQQWARLALRNEFLHLHNERWQEGMLGLHGPSHRCRCATTGTSGWLTYGKKSDGVTIAHKITVDFCPSKLQCNLWSSANHGSTWPLTQSLKGGDEYSMTGMDHICKRAEAFPIQDSNCRQGTDGRVVRQAKNATSTVVWPRSRIRWRSLPGILPLDGDRQDAFELVPTCLQLHVSTVFPTTELHVSQGRGWQPERLEWEDSKCDGCLSCIRARGNQLHTRLCLVMRYEHPSTSFLENLRKKNICDKVRITSSWTSKTRSRVCMIEPTCLSNEKEEGIWHERKERRHKCGWLMLVLLPQMVPWKFTQMEETLYLTHAFRQAFHTDKCMDTEHEMQCSIVGPCRQIQTMHWINSGVMARGKWLADQGRCSNYGTWCEYISNGHWGRRRGRSNIQSMTRMTHRPMSLLIWTNRRDRPGINRTIQLAPRRLDDYVCKATRSYSIAVQAKTIQLTSAVSKFDVWVGWWIDRQGCLYLPPVYPSQSAVTYCLLRCTITRNNTRTSDAGLMDVIVPNKTTSHYLRRLPIVPRNLTMNLQKTSSPRLNIVTEDFWHRKMVHGSQHPAFTTDALQVAHVDQRPIEATSPRCNN